MLIDLQNVIQRDMSLQNERKELKNAAVLKIITAVSCHVHVSFKFLADKQDFEMPDTNSKLYFAWQSWARIGSTKNILRFVLI